VSTGLYKGKSASPEEVGRELGVRYVLQGNVRRAGDHVRITTQLVDTQTGESTWAERYDGQLDDVFALQDRITDEIVQALDIKLVRGEGDRIIGRSIRSPRARDIYYRALAALFSFRREDIAEARSLLSEAAQLEPDSPLTHVFAAEGLYFEAALGYCERPEEALDEAMAIADRAIELDDPTGTAHMIQGFIQLRRRQHEAALESSERAISSRPSCPWAYALQGAIHNYADRPAEGIDQARLAIRHTPLVPSVFPAVLATAHYLLGQHGEAVNTARSTIRLAPDTLEASVLLAAALAAGGRTIEAEPIVKEIYRINAGFTLDAYARSQPYRVPNTLDGLLADLRAAGLS
jgi:tetratricopeptide (TPR) repeat protein